MMEFALNILILGFSALCTVSSDSACYHCRNGKACMEPSASVTPQEFCINDYVCGTQSTFTRPNTSVPYSKEAVSIERMCMMRRSVFCLLDKESQCIKKDTFLTCYSCCNTDKCNNYIPGYSSAVIQRKSSISLVITSAVLVWYLLMMT